jgi:hypothetical protein
MPSGQGWLKFNVFTNKFKPNGTRFAVTVLGNNYFAYALGWVTVLIFR